MKRYDKVKINLPSDLIGTVHYHWTEDSHEYDGVNVAVNLPGHKYKWHLVLPPQCVEKI